MVHMQETLGVDFDHHKRLEGLLRSSIRVRDKRITSLEFALSVIVRLSTQQVASQDDPLLMIEKVAREALSQ